MTTKKKQNSKVPKSAKTRFSDLTPKNDARAGRLPVVNPGSSRSDVPPPDIAKKHLIKYPPPSA